MHFSHLRKLIPRGFILVECFSSLSYPGKPFIQAIVDGRIHFVIQLSPKASMQVLAVSRIFSVLH